MGRFINFLPDRWHFILAAVCLISLPVAAISSGGWVVTHRDYVRAEQGRVELFDKVHDPQTGLIVRLASCERERDNATRMIRDQSARVAEWAAAAEITKARAEASVAKANERVRLAERRVNDLLSQQPRDNEGRCEAALRIIQEQVR